MDEEATVERVRTLAELGILDSAPEVAFDEIVELASSICHVPISAISLLDDKRQWIKAARGLPAGEIPIENFLCAHAIQRNEMLIVQDASKDERFAHLPMVTGEPGVRFYAGVPLSIEGGCPLGTLCVVDSVPRALSPDQARALAVLAHQAEVGMQMRAQRLALELSLRQQEELAAGLRASESLFRTFMNHSPYLCFIKDEDGRTLFYNREYAKQLGVTMVECLGKLDHELWPETNAREFRKHDLEVLAGGVKVEYDEKLMGKDGNMLHFHSIKFPYDDGMGKKLLAGVAVDVTREMARNADLARYQAELEAANLQLRQLAVTDGLTGLKNRRAFNERLAIEYSTASRVGRDLSVILIDIDHFKRVNDTHGHAAGDEVLRELSCVLETTVRLSDLAVRYGGEEFAVLLPDSNLAQTLRCAERFQDALKRGQFAHGPVTVSMGIAGIADGSCGEAMVACADEALYAAKRGGRNAIVAYECLSSRTLVAQHSARGVLR